MKLSPLAPFGAEITGLDCTKDTLDHTALAQLIARHWVIVNADNHRDEVRGLAVVGQQPLLKPGEHFEYTSWTRIATPHGTMRGTFLCMTDEAEPFDVSVPEFGLTLASALH